MNLGVILVKITNLLSGVLVLFSIIGLIMAIAVKDSENRTLMIICLVMGGIISMAVNYTIKALYKHFFPDQLHLVEKADN